MGLSYPLFLPPLLWHLSICSPCHSLSNLQPDLSLDSHLKSGSYTLCLAWQFLGQQRASSLFCVFPAAQWVGMNPSSCMQVLQQAFCLKQKSINTQIRWYRLSFNQMTTAWVSPLPKPFLQPILSCWMCVCYHSCLEHQSYLLTWDSRPAFDSQCHHMLI